PEGVPATRLGIRLSMTEPLAAVGANWRLDSTSGAGTTFEITRLGNAHQVADREAAKSDEGVASLPAEFPVRQLAAVICRDGADVRADRDLAAQREVSAAADLGGGHLDVLDHRRDGSYERGRAH